MTDGYDRCKKCGVVFNAAEAGYCPTCGSPAGSGKKGISHWFYSFEKKEFISVIIFAIIAIAFAAWNIYTVIETNNELAYERSVYEMAKGVVDSGLYGSVINNGYNTGYSSGEVYGAIAEMDSYFGFVDAVSAGYTIACSALIIGALLMVFRLRFSFKVMIGAYILTIVVMFVFDIWGMISYRFDISAVRIGIRVAIAGSLIKSLWRYDQMAYEGVKSESAVNIAPAASGVPMPMVRELNSDFDSFMAQTPPDKSMGSVGAANKDDVINAVIPAANTMPTENANMFAGKSADTSAQPVQSEPMQSAPATSKGMWFCSKCGSLNERGIFCGSCGSPKD